MTTPTDPPEREPAAGKPLPLQLELPGRSAIPPAESSPLVPASPRARRSPRTLLVLASGLVGAVALATIAAALLLPWYVRQACVASAAEHGVSLAIDDVTVGWGAFHLLGVRATALGIPGATARAPDVEIVTKGLSPERTTVHGAEVVVRGRLGDLESSLARWRASPTGGEAGGWMPAALDLDGARVVWQSIAGENVRAEAAEVKAQFVWHEASAEVHARSDRVRVFTPSGSLGPWRVDLDRVADASRFRLALDPGVPDASTVLVVSDAERTTSVDAMIPRSPLAHLGVPAELLGLQPSDDLQLEAELHVVALGPARSDIHAHGGLHGVSAPFFPRPLDVSWEGAASGSPSAGIEVKKARLAVGPLVGALTGTLQGFDDGFRADLAWAAGPVPCTALAAEMGLGQPFDIDYILRKLAATNTFSGTVSASVMLTFDSRDLNATKVDFRPEVRCSAATMK